MMVRMMKDNNLKSSTIFQIEGQEGHRVQEHLFTVMSIIAMMLTNGEGIIFQFYDIKKFFDKENLRNV